VFKLKIFRRLSIKDLAKISIIAALYIATTYTFYPLSYGDVQFRVSEVLMLLVCYNPIYSLSLVIGCAISNIISTAGWIDIIVGTFATFISCIFMTLLRKRIYIASLMPVFFNAFIVGSELHFVFDLPYWITVGQVALGEFVVVSLVGIPLFSGIEKNRRIMTLLDAHPLINHNKLISGYGALLLAFAIISLIAYFKLPLHKTEINKEVEYTCLYQYGWYYIFLPIFSFLLVAVDYIKDKFLRTKLFISLGMLLGVLIVITLSFTFNSRQWNYGFYLAIFFIPLLQFSVIYNRYTYNLEKEYDEKTSE
jgi:uncharacterized membrane protein